MQLRAPWSRSRQLRFSRAADTLPQFPVETANNIFNKTSWGCYSQCDFLWYIFQLLVWHSLHSVPIVTTSLCRLNERGEEKVKIKGNWFFHQLMLSHFVEGGSQKVRQCSTFFLFLNLMVPSMLKSSILNTHYVIIRIQPSRPPPIDDFSHIHRCI